jgi:hypothetical protein
MIKKIIEALPKTIPFKDSKRAKKFFYSGLCLRYSSSYNCWIAGYGRAISPNQKRSHIGGTPEEALISLHRAMRINENHKDKVKEINS